MVLVDKENVKGYVQMDEKEHTKKEYASKGLAGTALGLGIGGLAVSLLNNGCNPLGIDKQLVFDYNDIETFKQNILN